MSNTILSLSAAVALATIAACSGEKTAMSETASEDTAEIVAVDPATRVITLRDKDGEQYDLVAGPEVANFGQIEAGDQVVARWVQRVEVETTDLAPGDMVPDATAETYSANPGTKPGKAGTLTTNMVVEVISYDGNTGIATFRGPDGEVHTAEIDPAMRDFAAARNSGDRVKITRTEMIAVTVEEK